MLKLIAVTTNIREAEEQTATLLGITSATIRMQKKEIRTIFNIPDRTSIAHLATHPQIRQAIEFILTRKERTDRLQLRGAKKLDVIMPSGELVSVESFLKSLYPNENVNAISCYRALVARCRNKKVVKEDGSEATLADLPADVSVVRFLRQWKREFIAVRRAQSRQKDWEKTMQPYVTRDVTQYSPGELWIGDHTELDFMVLNEQGKADRRWITAFIDIRSGLLVGYHLSWQPNSTTIALAFRNGVLGSQLKAFTAENQYKDVQIVSLPDTVMIDNGKDYRSKYMQRLLGRIDFDDTARLSIQRITKLHYTTPYHGQSKAQMERWFGSFQTMLKHLPGYKGNVYGNKPDSLKEELKQGQILSVDQFDAMIALAVNVINNRVKKTLNGESPLQHYLTHQKVQRGIDLRVLDFLMMKSENKVVQRCQVRLKNAEYYSDQLMAFNGKRADVYYDPTDLGFVSVYVDGEFAAVACNKEMIGKDARGFQTILADRTRSEKQMREQIAGFRNGLSKTDAKMMLLHGELMNTQPVDAALLQKEAPVMIIRTGFEERANETQTHLDQEKVRVEVEQRSRRKKNSMPLTMDQVSKIR
ncbi:MAG: Mu transposase C-terminal domain-containing protein [Ignavibacteriales bacterium]|nr:Mu transposase C-terminal domain-containing protein [Ignavibacteriales bacterium]